MGKKLCSFFLLFLLCFSLAAGFFNFNGFVQAQTSYALGYSGATGALEPITDLVIGSLVSMPVAGSISNITVRFSNYASSTNKLTGKCAVYLHSDLSLVASTVARVDVSLFPAVNEIVFSFSSPIALQGGVDYILAFWGTSTYPDTTYVNYLSSGSKGHTQSIAYSGIFPDPLVAVENGYTYAIYTVYGDNTVVSSSPAIGADVTFSGTDYPTPAYFSLSNGNHTFAAEPSKVFGDHAYTFSHWIINGSDNYAANPLTLNITASTTITIYYTEYSGVFQFYGPYDELTGLLLNENVTVTAHYAESTGIPDYSFILNGTWVYPPDYNVQYFEYLFSDGSTRQYWLDPSEIITSIYVLKGNSTTGYVINFLDYTGILLTYPFVTVKAYVNGSLFTVEKLKVDEQNSIGAYLINGEKYQLIIGNEAYNFVYGDLLMTASTGVQLILRGVNFPKETLLMYKNVVLYALRDFSSNSISFYYSDSKNMTNSVTVTFTDSDGVVAYSNSFAADSISLNWTSAVNSTSYQLDVIVDHEEYGEFTWSQYFVKVSGEGAAMFDFSFLGNWSFDLTYLFPAILILFAAACFSALNAEVGALLSVIVAVFLTWMGWIPIPVGSLVAGLAFAILMALVYNKRRVGIY